MAKRKKKSNIGLLLALVAAGISVLGVVLYLSLDVTNLYVLDKTDDSWGISGIKAIFGYKAELDFGRLGKYDAGNVLNFSFMNLLSLILVVVGIVLVLFNSKLMNGIGALLFVGAAVLMLVTPNLISVNADLQKMIDAANKVSANTVTFKASIGSYLGMGCCGLAAIAGLGKALSK